jgi:hypothetical protein
LDRVCYAKEQFAEAGDRGKDGGQEIKRQARMGMIDDLKEGSYTKKENKG